MPAPLTPEERKRQADEAYAKAIATFPFEVVETCGEEALATWERLKRAGRGSPVVLGGNGDVARFADDLRRVYPDTHPAGRTVEEILATAAPLRHPDDLIARSASDDARAHEHLQQWLANPMRVCPRGSSSTRTACSAN